MPEDIRFSLTEEYIELYKLLKITGLAESGADGKYFVSEGRALVNGAVETRKGFKVRAGMRVELDGQGIQVQ